MKIINLFIFGITLFNLTLPAKANPTFSAQSTCQASVNSVSQQIKNKGVSHVTFEVKKGLANQSNMGISPKRNDVLWIILGADNISDKESYRIKDILYSLVLMNTWANNLANNCGTIAVVSFRWYPTDLFIDYYTQENP